MVVGSEVKTATGEVIGLYLTEEIPRGMPFADTVEAIRAQGAIVYVPHPFDRLHSIPDAALLRRLADQIDVLETCNGRLYREAYNREAERFAERYDLLAGAGSDAHVLEGLAIAVSSYRRSPTRSPCSWRLERANRASSRESRVPPGPEMAAQCKEPHAGRRKLAPSDAEPG